MSRQESLGVDDPRGRVAAPGADDQIDLGGLWAAIKRRKWWIILPTLATCVAASAFSLLVSPRYSADARVLLEIRETELTQIGRTVGRDNGTIDTEAVQSQVQVVTSYDLARQAIRKLGLVGNAEFDPAASGLGAVERVLMMIGIAKVPSQRESEERILETYYNRLQVFPVGKSRVLSIEFTSKDRELAARAANVIADLYVESLGLAKQGIAKSAGSWLSAAIDPLRERVREAEAKVEVFRSRSGLLTTSNNSTVLQQQLAETSTQLSAARSAKSDAESKLKLIREALRQNKIFELSEVVNNEAIRRLLEQRGTLKAQIANESRNLLPEHPQIKALNAQLADIEQQVRAAADRTIRTIESDARIAAARVETLTAALEEHKARVSEANNAEVQLRALEREAKTLREQLESYLTRFREASSRDLDNSNPPDARVISRAVVPQKPSFPKPLPIILIATLCALGVTLALVTVRELAATRADAVALEEELPAPVAVAPPPPPVAVAVPVPAVSAEERPRRAASLEPAVPDADSLLALAKRIDDNRERDGSMTISVVGKRSDLSIAVEFARTMARSSRVLLLLLQRPAPGLMRAAAEDGAGLVDLVAGKSTFTEVIRREPDSKLHWIGPGIGSVDKVADDKMALDFVMEALAATYDVVVLAAPMGIGDALASRITRRTDAVVVVGTGEEPDTDTVAAFERFSELSGREPYVLLVESAGAPEVSLGGAGPRAVA